MLVTQARAYLQFSLSWNPTKKHFLYDSLPLPDPPAAPGGKRRRQDAAAADRQSQYSIFAVKWLCLSAHSSERMEAEGGEGPAIRPARFLFRGKRDEELRR